MFLIFLALKIFYVKNYFQILKILKMLFKIIVKKVINQNHFKIKSKIEF